jgi:YD repeat-containing protein
MSEPDYYYTRTKDGKMVESGKMDFEAEIMAYLQQHPEAGRLLFTKYGFNPVMDFIARHSPGKLVATRTFIYNAKGQLMEEKGYYNITYTRDSAGRVVTKISDEGIITNYYYLANGLLEGHVTSHGDGRPSESRFYRYTFQ